MGSQLPARSLDSRRRLIFAAGLAVVFAAGLQVFAAEEPWREKLKPGAPGAFPPVRPFTAAFRFGWSDIEAARATARASYKGSEMIVEAEGGTTGLARLLWQLDATHRTHLWKEGLEAIWFHQFERYASRTIATEAVFRPKGAWKIRRIDPDPGKIAKWKKVKIHPMRDMVSAMLFIRSQPLDPGDKIGLIAFPGDNPFLVETKVLRREEIEIGGVRRPALLLELRLHRIVDKGEDAGKLEPHAKFRSGRVWISDDADRIPLRAEVNIFIGYVFAELESITFPDGKGNVGATN